MSFTADRTGVFALRLAGTSIQSPISRVQPNCVATGQQLKNASGVNLFVSEIFAVTIDQLNQSPAFPGLSVSQWTDFNTQNSGKVFRLLRCNLISAVLVQINGRVLSLSKMNERQKLSYQPAWNKSCGNG